MKRVSLSDQQNEFHKTLILDCNSNAAKVKDEQSQDAPAIVAPSDNWIARLLYGSPVGLTVNFALLISCTLYYVLTIQNKLEDEFFREKVFKPSWVPFAKQLFTYTLPLDILMMTFLACVFYPLSRLSRETSYYWMIGVTCSLAMYIMICFDLDTITLPVRLLTVVDCTRLSMKVCAFLVECNRSDEVFTKSSVKSLLYYLLIPHLIYQHEYPRTPRVRWVKFFCHLWWTFIGMFLVASHMIEYFARSTFDPMTVSTSELIIKSLKVSAAIGVSYILVVWFFIFENFCGLHGELCRFPDLRLFDIRNLFNGSQLATEINIIVSKWLSRYVFIPAIKSTGSRFKALFYTITVSFVFHEICILYILHVSVLFGLLAVIILGPTLLSLKVKNKLLAVLLGMLLILLVLCYAAVYPLEYFAWNFSSMSGLESKSIIRWKPLFYEQLTMSSAH